MGKIDKRLVDYSFDKQIPKNMPRISNGTVATIT